MKKWLMAAAVLGATLSAGAGAFAAGDPKAELVALEAKWSAALVANDDATVAGIVAADWNGHSVATGKLTTKDMLLADLKADKDRATSMTNRDVQVRIIGDVAIVQGADDEVSTHEGKDTSGTYTWTDVFQKRGGHWVAIASQGTKVVPAK